jgi:hypothetical protein
LPETLEGLRIEALPDPSLPAQGPGRAGNGNFVLTRIRCSVIASNGEAQTIALTNARASIEQERSEPPKRWSAASVLDEKGADDLSGWAILPGVGQPQQLVVRCSSPPRMHTGDKLKLELVQHHGHGNHTIGHFRISVTSNSQTADGPVTGGPSKELVALLNISAEKRDKSQTEKLWTEFKKAAPELADLRQQIEAARKAKADYDASLPHTLISVSDAKPRTVRILPRGNFLNESGDIVQPALPGYLKASWQPLISARRLAADARLTRLDLANWIVSPGNPLTARVTMNRLWKQFFGGGIAKSLDDFGMQGETPKNQELLDWLACEFMESGWDMKHMVRLILNSHTYRQSSVLSKKARELDPYNREFSAQGRWRLDAELVRDNALSISGLLVSKIGGPSIKPYQPDGYWENLNFPPRTYQQSAGEDQYRRGLYVWWQRSYLHPSLQAFDAPTREECVAERNRSNIPQQALVLLNDPTYVEASRVFAARIIKQGGSKTDDRITWGWRQALDRAPRKDELQVARELLAKHLSEYKADTKSADALLHVGLAPVAEGLDHAELAAWTSVARLILNLHETITRN